MLEAVRTALRIKSTAFDDEITDLIEACIVDLHQAGAEKASADDILTKQAVILYCKAYFGNGLVSDPDKYAQHYRQLKIQMANSSEYSDFSESTGSEDSEVTV